MSSKKYVSFDIGIKNLAYCIVCYDTQSKTIDIKEWKTINIVSESTSTTSSNAKNINESLIDFLHQEFFDFEFYDDDQQQVTILIENQPVMKNPVMKSIQMIIYTFFMMLRYQMYPNMTVRFISASNKLKVKNQPKFDDETISKCKTSYTSNKKKSIAIATHYLENIDSINKHKPMFIVNKKKDDLADSFLQAIYVLENENDIEYH